MRPIPFQKPLTAGQFRAILTFQSDRLRNFRNHWTLGVPEGELRDAAGKMAKPIGREKGKNNEQGQWFRRAMKFRKKYFLFFTDLIPPFFTDLLP